jgi:hypothetical protein
LRCRRFWRCSFGGRFAGAAALFLEPGGFLAHLAAAGVFLDTARFLGGKALLLFGLASTSLEQGIAPGFRFSRRQTQGGTGLPGGATLSRALVLGRTLVLRWPLAGRSRRGRSR